MQCRCVAEVTVENGCYHLSALGSKRLPGEVMEEILPGRTMLDVLIERVCSSKRIDQVVVALPDSKQNDIVAAEAEHWGVGGVGGSERDVLARYVGARGQY